MNTLNTEILENYYHLLSHTLTLLWDRAYYKNGVPHVNIITEALDCNSGLKLKDGDLILLQPLMEIGYLTHQGVTWDEDETKMEVFTLNTLEEVDWNTADAVRSLDEAVVHP